MSMMIHRSKKRRENRGALPSQNTESLFNDQKKGSQEAEQKYTKSEINRMSTADLQNLAEEEGIKEAFKTSGNELKKILADHFGL